MAEPTRGTCVVCGCDADAHDDWTDETRTICNPCVPCVPGLIASLRAAVEAEKAETQRLQLDAHTVETSMATVSDLSERLEAALARAEKAEAELKRLTTWHPASEPPDTGRCMLVECDDGLTRVDFWYRRYQRWATVGVSVDAVVTHWRELPPGPDVKVAHA